MIPCKMPDESLSALSETIDLLHKAGDAAKEMVEAEYDDEFHALYQELARDIDNLKKKAEEISTKTSQLNL